MFEISSLKQAISALSAHQLNSAFTLLSLSFSCSIGCQCMQSWYILWMYYCYQAGIVENEVLLLEKRIVICFYIELYYDLTFS
jgi:hypothetical protein